MDEAVVERVLRAAELVPPGQVVSYGDIAALVGTSPRLVGAVMSRHGHQVPWWRVTNSRGDHIVALRAEAFAHWAEEGISVKPNGLGCQIRQYRPDLERWAEAWDSGPLL